MVNLFAIAKNVGRTVYEGAKTGFSHPLEATKAVVKTVYKGGTQGIPNSTPFVMPISVSPVSGGAGAVSKAASSIKQGVQTAVKRLTTNPLAGLKPAEAVKKLAAGTAATIASIKGLQIARKIGKKEDVGLRDVIPTKSEAILGADIAYNAPLALFGFGTGNIEKYGKQAANTALDVWGKIIPDRNAFFNNMEGYKEALENVKPNTPILNITMPEFTMPEFNLTMPNIEMPQVSTIMPGVGVNVGGVGGGGLDLAMLALLLGGTGGYLLSKRKKRKKRKYKKRRRH